jgi:hypothetical protein
LFLHSLRKWSSSLLHNSGFSFGSNSKNGDLTSGADPTHDHELQRQRCKSLQRKKKPTYVVCFFKRKYFTLICRNTLCNFLHKTSVLLFFLCNDHNIGSTFRVYFWKRDIAISTEFLSWISDAYLPTYVARRISTGSFYILLKISGQNSVTQGIIRVAWCYICIPNFQIFWFTYIGRSYCTHIFWYILRPFGVLR